MAKDPYKSGVFKKNPYAKKNPIIGQLSVVLDGIVEDRGLELIVPISRAVLKNEIHELIFTDEVDAAPGRVVNRIAYLGFMEINEGGVMVAGDQVILDGQVIGEIAGFDPTHLPNHLNIIIKSTERKTGVEMNVELGAEIVIKKAEV